MRESVAVTSNPLPARFAMLTPTFTRPDAVSSRLVLSRE